jgi:hypothetical protein
MDLTMKLYVNAFFDQFKAFSNFISDQEFLSFFSAAMVIDQEVWISRQNLGSCFFSALKNGNRDS